MHCPQQKHHQNLIPVKATKWTLFHQRVTCLWPLPTFHFAYPNNFWCVKALLLAQRKLFYWHK
ncbi:unnamed protein product [Arabidopsis thaliana]|uniref:(thale cress) hypothetical protein n=1 Tax=Arabidopsis thaliana TaxID=3702 RepID=A0A7G2F365_ARATH|nr:unnamed protein product [Arabidopsis thaliana]